MRAGGLDRIITVQRSTHTVNDYGTPGWTWTDLATLRARIVEGGTEETVRPNAGSHDEVVFVFRTRWRGDITTADRILHAGEPFDLVAVKEIGRRAGLELRVRRGT